MKKAVLISIRPKWCELIVSGEKTIEVRKTRPKIKTPFKCYIYCTDGFCSPGGDAFSHGWRKQVICEFVCDCVLNNMHDGNADRAISEGKIPEKELLFYSDGKPLCGWHISDLVIYDKPKELGEFKHCGVNYHYNPVISRPPQSWCYVEDITG